MSTKTIVETTEERVQAVIDVLDAWLNEQLRKEIGRLNAPNLTERQLVSGFIRDLEEA